MTEAFVDVLEVIQIYQQHGAAAVVTLGPLQGMLDSFGEQQAVGQVAQGIMVGQVVQFALGALEGADVGEHRNEVADLALFVADGADVLPLRVHLAILAAVPHLAAPGATVLQSLPHAVIEGGVMPAGFQQAGLQADDFLLAVAGDAAEGRVAVHDALLGIGDQHPFLGGVEYRGGLAQAVFIIAPLGDVAGGAGQALGVTAVVHQQLAAGLDPAIAAVLVAHAVGDIVGLRRGGAEQLPEVVLVQLAVFRVQQAEPVLVTVAQLGQAQAQQLGIAGGKLQGLAAQVQVPGAITGRLQGALQAPLAVVQGTIGQALLVLVGVQDAVQQHPREQDEAQALGQLQTLQLFDAEAEGGQHGVTEQYPASGSQQIDQGQAPGAL